MLGVDVFVVGRIGMFRGRFGRIRGMFVFIGVMMMIEFIMVGGEKSRCDTEGEHGQGESLDLHNVCGETVDHGE